jgi:GTP-binding protein EngB required for normal cell division
VRAIVESAKQAIGRGGDVTTKVDGLERALVAARGRLDDAVVDAAQEVVDRAEQRLRLSGDHTVVALAGATGSGKSSLFNALAGLDLAAIGVRRPTTSWALSCTWGVDGSSELLDWLGIPRRHQVSRDSMLDGSEADTALHGLVLVDLPDHDSTEVSHHVEVDRLVALADVIIWVLDPQKYADAAVHDRYLKPLARHDEIVMVVFNHVDEIPPEEVDTTMADVARLVAEDGLDSVEPIATSAINGRGIDELRAQLVKRVRAKKSSKARLIADIEAAAERLGDLTGEARPADVGRTSRTDLVDAFADAAGVPIVVHAVREAMAVRARRATGWPVTAGLSRFRPDPLKRLHLDLGPSGKVLTGTSRASLPQANEVQRARVDQTVRNAVDKATQDLPRPWSAAVRRASVSRLDDVSDALDKAIVTTDLGVSRTPWWWSAVRAVQWVVLLAMLTGAVWLAALFLFTYLRLPEPPTPQWYDIPVPTLLFLGGAAVGIALAVLCRGLAALSARRHAEAVNRRLRAAITEVVDELVIEPIEVELDAYRACRDGVEAARR